VTDSQIDQYTYRDDFIDSIEIIVDRGKRLLEVEEVEINSKDYLDKASWLNTYQCEFFPVLMEKLQSHNIPEINISPDGSRPPDDETLKVTRNTLSSDTSMYCAIYAVYEGSQFLSQIKSLPSKTIAIAHSLSIADDYSKLVLVNLLLNLPSSAIEIGSKGGRTSAINRNQTALDDRLIIWREADELIMKGGLPRVH
jgi:hypothetical protein